MPMPQHPIPHHSVALYISVLNWIVSLSLDKWQKFVQIIALILGGIGAYFRWFKGRVYKGRLEANVSGTAVWKHDNIYINAVVSIKNIGLTKLDIDQTGTALRLSYCEPRTNVVEIASVLWEHIGTFPMFENDRFVESGETIQDQLMLSVPKKDVDAFQIELNVCAGKSLWRSRAIVKPEEKAKPPHRRIIT